MLHDKPMRAAPYVRVSTETQIENYSTEQQIERLEAYCKAKGWPIYKIYTDGGYSGGNTNRPALTQLLCDIQGGDIDVVVVYKLDRLSRSQKDTLTLIEDSFIKNGVDFVSVNENFDTSTPFGRAMIGILSVFAQLEKDQITERFTMGRVGRCKAGHFHGGVRPPTGYRYIDGGLVVDEYKASQVREVYELFLRGYSINSIQRQMYEKYAGGWSTPSLVMAVLKNSTYTGKVKFKGVEYDGIHQPIIDENTYNAVQSLYTSPQRQSKRTTQQKTPFRANYLLTSLIFCGGCGARYHASHGCYRCYSRSKTSKKNIIDPNCKNKNWKISELDELIIDEIKSLKMNPAYVDEFLASTEPGKASDEDLQKRIKEIDAQITKVIDLYQVSSIPTSEISSRIESLQAEKNGLLAMMEPKAKDTHTSRDRILEMLDNLETALIAGPLEEKRLRIREIIESITIVENSIAIKWRI